MHEARDVGRELHHQVLQHAALLSGLCGPTRGEEFVAEFSAQGGVHAIRESGLQVNGHQTERESGDDQDGRHECGTTEGEIADDGRVPEAPALQSGDDLATDVVTVFGATEVNDDEETK